MDEHLNHSDPGGAFEMLYCDRASCRVNTFERGDGSDNRRGSGRCPGCGDAGEVIR